MPSRFLTSIAVTMLSGCVVGNIGNKLELGYVPDSADQTGLASKTFNLTVTDARPYVTHGKKYPYYLGIYRGGYGNPFDVYLKGKVALSDQMKGDFRSEFQALGMVETAEGSSKKLLVRIRDWNFDAGIDARFWYDVELTVADAEGKQLAVSRVKDEKIIKGNVLAGPQPAMKEAMPAYYGDVIRKLVREDASILSALRL